MGDSLIIFVAALIGSVVIQSALELWAFRLKNKAHELETEDLKTQIAGLQTVVVSQNEYIKRLEQEIANFKHSFSNTFLNKN